MCVGSHLMCVGSHLMCVGALWMGIMGATHPYDRELSPGMPMTSPGMAIMHKSWDDTYFNMLQQMVQ